MNKQMACEAGGLITYPVKAVLREDLCFFDVYPGSPFRQLSLPLILIIPVNRRLMYSYHGI